jgi:hypothetical protein
MLSGLSANTLYNFDVVSGVPAGNTNTTSANFRFATLSSSPIIGDTNIIYLTNTGVTINWTTDQPSTGMVNYGTTTNYASSTPVITTPTIAHAVTLGGLAPGTTYNFAVVSSASTGGPSTSTNQTFTTAASNATAPNVGFVASWGITNSSAMISWSTDAPANTVLAYGTTPALGQLTPVQATLSASHGVTLTGLDSGTSYYFVAISTGSGGATGYSTLSSLTTTGQTPLAPVISSVASSNLTTTAATITWTTDVPTNSMVNYGTTTSYGFSALDSSLRKAHSVTLTGLTPGTRYVFQVVSASPAGVSTFGADLSGFTIWAWGDSQTLGGEDGSRNNYPGYLSTDLGVPVVNEGVGGNTSTQIAQRMLATPASFVDGNCHVIWSGSNNPAQVSQILSDVASMVNVLDAPKCFLVLSDVNQVSSPIGSSTYSSIVETGTSLASEYGTNYLDIRELLVQAYNPALPIDVADHAMDIPPSSLRAVVALGNITSGALDSASCVFSVSSGTQGPGTVVIIDSETILINAVSNNLNITDCVRGYNGTVATNHAAYATYSKIDDVHLGSNGLDFVASQVAAWFKSQSWPFCVGDAGVICPFPANFTTAATETPGPVISAIAVSSITSASAVVTWTTDQPATSLVNYGTTTGYGTTSTLDPTLTTTHSVALAGLAPNSIYNFDVVSANSTGGSSTSANSTFTTTAASGPAISGVGATNLTPNSVTITWTTSQPATAQVSYGTTLSYGMLTPVMTALATSQAVSLTGLTPNTIYDYQVISANSAGASSTSANYTFTTPAASATPPQVGYLAFWGINNTSITISWSTDVNANTAVAYGTTLALGQTYVNNGAGYTSTTNHGVVLTGLTPGTKYYFVAQSTGANGATGYSSVYSFTTTGTALTGPGFTLTATAAAVNAGSTGTSTVTVTPSNGFNSAVTLAASGWPAGITGTFGTNPATASSIVTITIASGVSAGPYTLTVNGTSAALTGTTTIALTVTPVSSKGSAAIFTGLDTTEGTWTGTYGSDGSIIANGTSNLASYAKVGFTGALTYTWAGLTSDPRALQTSAGSTARIASSYYSSSSGGFTISMGLTDGATHQVAIYLLDWDTTTRQETISITDAATGALLDSRSFSGFHNGAYGVWNITGTVMINVAAVAFNPVVSAIFFAPAGGLSAPPGFTLSATAAAANAGSTGTSTVTIHPANGFNSAVTLAASNWPTGITGTFGTNPATASSTVTINAGANVAPGPYTLTVTGTSSALSATTTIALTVSGATQPGFNLSATAATANVGSTGTSTITIAPVNGFNSAVTLAASSWPAGITGTFGTNPATGSSVVTISVGTSVAAGPYLLTVSGASSALTANTTIALTVNSAPPGLSNSASFVGLDTTTEGAWTGKYGSAGYMIADGSTVNPAYATVGIVGASTYTWAEQTTDIRALQSSAGASTRIASAYTQYAGQEFTINIEIAAGKTQTVSLYLLDWDGSSRNETISILDPVTNTVLDTETFSGFHNGQYASWNIKGNVTIRVTPNGFVSPAVSGLFLN